MFRICNGSNFRELIFLCFTLEKKMEVPALHVELTCSALSTMTLYLYQYLYQSPRVAAFKRGFLDFWEYQKTFQQVQKFLRESIPPTSMGTHFKMMCLSKCFKVVLRHFFLSYVLMTALTVLCTHFLFHKYFSHFTRERYTAYLSQIKLWCFDLRIRYF